MSDSDGVADRVKLPNDKFAAAWDSIKLEAGIKERLLAQALLTLNVRRKLAFEVAPLHGLVLLKGPPGTGKTTLARGLANQIATQLVGARATFVEIDAHALTGAHLGQSQQAVSKLFEATIPEAAINGVAIVLLDEIETLAVDRQKLSLDANPVDVHRATDAALTGLDRLMRQNANVLLIATTNFPKAVDRALLSRADHIEEIPLPPPEIRRQIIGDTLKAVGAIWKDVLQLLQALERLVEASHGLDGRRIRKAIFAGAASDIDSAKDLNNLRAAQIEAAFRQAKETAQETEQ